MMTEHRGEAAHDNEGTKCTCPNCTKDCTCDTCGCKDCSCENCNHATSPKG